MRFALVDERQDAIPLFFRNAGQSRVLHVHAQFLAIPDQDLVLHLQLFSEREYPNLQQAFSVCVVL